MIRQSNAEIFFCSLQRIVDLDHALLRNQLIIDAASSLLHLFAGLHFFRVQLHIVDKGFPLSADPRAAQIHFL